MARQGEAVAATVLCAGGTFEVDGHRPLEFDTFADNTQVATRQIRVTDNHGNVVELAVSRRDVKNIVDVLDLYV